ncbi:hypothetical protein M427DRAFT_260600 [Gonapodya prolifera JEL478]|uniref:Uncharacterized protein n=1 Tax=Gonapodya prolifera (strain JEL478) TaxID=1344416 RepID=A0A139AKS6_GONPJ|nr:hypothetical protein M427DRAFT_260600 [Gonapodya prolifera JEL478]|eukprot:KXS17401.1 hypothetical protein M427DRAFT_260600 [Gonapodya prolifera JEL478]
MITRLAGRGSSSGPPHWLFLHLAAPLGREDEPFVDCKLEAEAVAEFPATHPTNCPSSRATASSSPAYSATAGSSRNPFTAPRTQTRAQLVLSPSKPWRSLASSRPKTNAAVRLASADTRGGTRVERRGEVREQDVVG